MSALEQEIIKKFHQLDKDAQARIRALIERETESKQTEKPQFDFAAWSRDIEAIRQQITDDNGGIFPSMDVVGMLREIRDGEDDE